MNHKKIRDDGQLQSWSTAICVLHTPIAAVFLIALVVAGSRSALAQEISIQSFSHPPNYHLTKDGADSSQLTDGKLERYPIWLRRGTVGWHNKTPVIIRAEVTGATPGLLRLRVAKGTYAGVWPPIRIDVYRAATNGFRHSGSYQGLRDALEDKTTHWLEVPVIRGGRDVRVIINAQATNIFIDEIQWRAGGEEQEAGAVVLASEVEILADSIERLKAEYIEAAMPTPDALASWSSLSSRLHTWKADPWGRLALHPMAAEMISGSVLDTLGTQEERQTLCLGLFHPTHDRIYDVVIDEPWQSAVSVRVLGSMLAANGELVHDPLMPLGDDGVRIERGKATYLWIELDLTKIEIGTHELQIKLHESADKNAETSIPLMVEVLKKHYQPHQPAAVNWAYTSSMPIWEAPRKAVKDLVDHGINIFVIPTQHIPLPRIDGSWDVKTAVKLRRDLQLFAPHAKQILLALGWHPDIKPKWLGPNSNTPTAKQEAALGTWARQLDSFMAKSGVPKEKWLLYPVDEPFGEKKEGLKNYLRILTEAVPSFRFYTNPTAARPSKRISTRELAELDKYIDQWGPNLKYAESAEGDYFRANNHSIWVYHNPRYPAKTGSPLLDYRLPAWRAWLAGASGVGVWSYDDTQGSSAWDDFDGPRGDWAMVYESATGPVSSRRWEAFREGIEDLQILRGLAAQGCLGHEESLAIKTLVEEQPATSANLDALRTRILSAPCPS